MKCPHAICAVYVTAFLLCNVTNFQNAKNFFAFRLSFFFKMPKVLFTDKYKNLSAEAKLLYGLMLDRMNLSAINGWCDKNGEVFIFYTIAETSEMLGCGYDKATRLQRELEKHNLLRRKYQGKGKPAKLYVLDIPKTRIRSP